MRPLFAFIATLLSSLSSCWRLLCAEGKRGCFPYLNIKHTPSGSGRQKTTDEWEAHAKSRTPTQRGGSEGRERRKRGQRREEERNERVEEREKGKRERQ